MIDSAGVKWTTVTDDAVYFVAFFKEKFGFNYELHRDFLTTNYADYTNVFYRRGAKFLRL